MRRSKLFDRPNMKDRSIMPTDALRTGNALIKASLLTLRAGPFNERFGRTGGEDTDLFAWLQRQDFKFVWAEYAEVFEKIAEKRRHLRWHMVRGYRGGWTYSYQLVGRYGWFVGFCLSTVRIIPSILRSFLYFIMNLSNIRAAIYLLARETSGHIG
jgi:succinoglycan biosynthesis protein ExoM